MKKLDKLMIKQFIGPFFVTFAIAMFVLIMQALWQYLERIAGKGLSFFTVIELLSYKCVGLVPLALPLALLISSVMVLGGMAEHYELSSIKSAGTSLLRVMMPMIVFGVLSAGASFMVSDYVIPAANLQFGARMYDINQKKPTLNMEPGMFNTDFNGFAIRLGERDTDGRNISDVLIYDHSRATTGDLGQITAKTGQMYTENDGQALVMELNDGVQYSDRKTAGSGKNSLPYVRTYFDTYEKIFDLKQFNLGQTDVSLFETNRSMLSSWQLQIGIDSISDVIGTRKQTISNHAKTYLPLLRKDTTKFGLSTTTRFSGLDSGSRASRPNAEDDELSGIDSLDVEELITDAKTSPLRPTKQSSEATQLAETRDAATHQGALEKARKHRLVTAAADWPGMDGMLLVAAKDGRKRTYNRARSGVRSVVSQAASTARILPGIHENRIKYVYDKHMKFSMAVVCIIFIFIGAPMGAIVRKGGFGYPILVSIIFFVIFIILTILCRKLAESFVVNGVLAGWLPCIILFPVSLYITDRAMKDAKLIDFDNISDLFKKLYARYVKKGAPTK
ncbi:LptF/LptG family permease [Neolewinella antarctica]|uniref:Lipopolysaccharide export system permease protein n=1 Tax=Neolewinella antarctica TaxID=442734 RepID=A0ABX0X7Z4_9BACT|nr:LptF/LptG family permease [Neolewinella antarctica]NJC24947.1 lipopolysaccharide export system permease protein [Neolewinella antarctica]